MKSIFISILISLFSNPYIKNVKEEKGLLNVTIFNKKREYGYIIIKKDSLKYYISYGIKSSKGLVKTSELELIFEKNILLLKSLKNRKKKILKIRCGKENYNLIKGFLEKLKTENRE